MIPLFLGLTAANLFMIVIVFALGLFAVDVADQPTSLYAYHISMGVAAGLMTALTHVAVYTYFMATCKWLGAATQQAGLDATRYVAPAVDRKKRVIMVAMLAITSTVLALFAGAGADPTVNPWWPAQVHLFSAVLALVVNAICGVIEYRHIRDQGALMDRVLAFFNKPAADAHLA